jgi:hypothetical protein
MTYDSVLVVDLATLVTCVALLWRYAKLSHAHPATIYFVFHLFVVTARVAALIGGAPTLFTYDSETTRWPSWIAPVTEEEIVRAVLMADFVLGIMTAAWIWASSRKHHEDPRKPTRFTPLRPLLVWIVVTIAFPMGVLAVALFSSLPGRNVGLDLGAWNTSSYPLIVQSWAGLSILALMYLYGFKPYLIVPMAIYLLIMVYQGFHRFRVLIPVILMIQIYLSRTGRTWPPRKMIAILLTVGALFFSLKKIGRMAQQGQSFDEIATLAKDAMLEAATGAAGDQQLLDQFASALSLVDQGEDYFYGQPYLALLVLPIPRQFWPEKPSVADYQRDFSRRWRPMHETGMIVTFIGEFYAQLGLVSVVVCSFLFAYVLGRLYHSSALRPYYSLERFYYLLVACNLIQIYRDGLVSLVIFIVVNMSPLFVVAVTHLIAGIRRPLSSPGAAVGLPPALGSQP